MKSILLLITMFLVSACSHSSNPEDTIEITVSAAASLKDALEEIKIGFNKEFPDIKLYYNFSSSGALQQQIIQGAPTDLFLSASVEKFEQLAQRNLIKKDQSIDILQNSLVLIGKKDSTYDIQSIQELEHLEESKVAIGTPETVPAGAYAKEAFHSLGTWNSMQSRLVFAKDVRQVLSYVESGNVLFGIVYHTDAMSSGKVKILSEIEDTLHSKVIYSLGVVKHTNHPEEAEAFYQFIQSKTAIGIFEKYGFKGLNK
jgi:molybdate transport system substrate-binding protein